MRRTHNEVTLIGFVGQKPTFSKVGEQQLSFAVFSLITNEAIKTADPDKPGKFIFSEKPSYHKIVAWRQTAELIEKFVNAKDYVFVRGTLSNNEYRDGNGNQIKSTEIVVENIKFLDKRQNADAIPEPDEKRIEVLNEVPAEFESFEDQ